MELFIFLLLVTVCGFWYINYIMKNKEEKLRQSDNRDQMPYKLEGQESKLEVVKEETKIVEEIKTIGPTPCGCGRSPTGLCVGLHKLSTDEWAVHNDNPNKVQELKEVKKTRKPRAPKTATVATNVPKTRGRKPAAKKITTKKTNSKKS